MLTIRRLQWQLRDAEFHKGPDSVGVFVRTSFFERFFEGVRTKRDRLTGAVSAGVAFRRWD